MKTTRVIGVEGGVGAGKTTALRAALTQLESTTLMREYMEFPQRHSLVTLSQFSPQKRFDYFFEIEYGRRLMLPASGIVLLDRTFLTLVSYEYAHRAMDLPNSLQYSVSRIMLGCDKVIFPSLIFYLSITSNTRRARISKRSNSTLDILVTDEFNFHVERFFRTYSDFMPLIFLTNETKDAVVSAIVVESAQQGPLNDDYPVRLQSFMKSIL